MTSLKNAISNTDWQLLRKQKNELYNLTHNNPTVAGLIYYLDAIQDAAVEDGIATEEEVFGVQNE